MVSKKKILVVEDDVVIRETMRELLEFEGYAVECAENGEVGIQALRRNELLPCLILLDINMPVKDGFQFRAEQEQDAVLAHVPVLVMTADFNIQAKADKINAKGYIKKPFDVDYVIEMVSRFCL